jgi:hypothetical protein
MPSSTSSFKTYRLERIIPRHPWAQLAVICLALVALLALGWESACREMGYRPTLNDTADLWASRRVLLDENPNRTVLIGSSRMLFDFDMDVYESAMGERPLQLATVGSNPLPYLEDFASSPKFSGTVIVGVVPYLYFAPGGPPVKNPLGYLDRYRNWSPSQRMGHHLGVLLERRLAFLQQEDLTLNQLLLRLKIPNRPSAKVGPELPPYFYEVDLERQGGMTDAAERDAALQKRIQNIWIPLFTPPPPAQGTTPAQVRAEVDKAAESILQRTQESVEKIRARGGHVVFVRFPSSGGLRELENKITPRGTYWDRVLKVSSAPGIHFEDHAELSDFDCPEWSHLSKKDAVLFTGRLIPHFKKIRAAGQM